MGVCVLGLHCKAQTKKIPQVMDRAETREDNGHVIDITSEPSSSTSTQDRQVNRSNTQQTENLPSTSVTDLFQHTLSTTNGTNTRNTPFARRANGSNGRRRSPLNSGYWISFELVITVSQIIAAIVVLSMSRHEHPRAPLFKWVIGYASGCVATLPLLLWRFYFRNDTSDQDPAQHRQNSSPTFLSAMATSLTSSNARTSVGDTNNATGTSTTRPVRVLLNARLKVLVEYFKMGLDCFFAVWFVVGNVWIFGGHSSASDAPNLYRLCLVFLAFSCIGYAMPFILCATICCCLPCIISVLGFREDLSQNRGATSESINSLPTYKFKIKKHKHGSNRGSHETTNEGGVVAAGTENERVLSGEDAVNTDTDVNDTVIRNLLLISLVCAKDVIALPILIIEDFLFYFIYSSMYLFTEQVCCICLAKYANNDELRQLMCTHFFHKDCVDKWLKINASCPLCKSEVGESALSSLTEGGTQL